MFVAPLGIAALLAAHLGKAGGGAAFFSEVAAIGKYCFCVVLGLGIHGFIVLPVLLKLLTGRSAFRYAYNLGEALLTAFSTASSSATLALTMDLSEKRNRIRSDTASFVLPLGATVNMDGTALYEAVAVMFIAQASGIEVSFGGQVLIVVTATLASVGAAGIPQAGLVTMVLVLEAVGLPADGISAILAVDWLLDRFRTTVNVWGDAVGAGVVDAHSETVLHGPV
jgi:Na+/H+-dicarboxylate symporter